MESHLRNLESRADRRERELRATVEDVKATAKLEYARLQAIHSQECREKDEELVRFQRDLELLVRSLRQWQDTAMNKNNNKVDNNNFNFISSNNNNIVDSNHNDNYTNDTYNDNNNHRNDNNNHMNDKKLSYNDKNKSENNNRNSNSFLSSGVDNFTEIPTGVNNKENFTKRNLHDTKNQKKFLRF